MRGMQWRAPEQAHLQAVGPSLPVFEAMQVHWLVPLALLVAMSWVAVRPASQVMWARELAHSRAQVRVARVVPQPWQMPGVRAACDLPAETKFHAGKGSGKMLPANVPCVITNAPAPFLAESRCLFSVC